jgi:UDP-glucose-4-epimerase GalE
MSVLVTGGAGYIGSHTVRRLTALGHEVVVLDSMEYGHRNAVIEAELVEGNIADLDLVVELCTRRDITQVVHFAAYKNVGESMEQPSRYWLNNVTGTVKLVEAMLTAGVNDIVFSSSCSCTATRRRSPSTRTRRSDRRASTPNRRQSPSGSCTGTACRTGCDPSACATSMPQGASADSRIGEDWRETLNLVPVVMKATLGRRPAVKVFGTDYPTADGTCIRDYIHVDDLADAHVKALDYLSAGGASTALNVGTGSWQQRDGSDRRDRSESAVRRCRGRLHRDAPATLSQCSPTPVAPASCSAGIPNTASTTSSPRHGTGTAHTSTATTARPRLTLTIQPTQ